MNYKPIVFTDEDVSVVVADEPNEKPVADGLGVLVVVVAAKETAGTPNENVFGAAVVVVATTIGCTAGAELLNGTPKLNLAAADDEFPNENDDADNLPPATTPMPPGFSSSQHSHFFRWASLRVMHAAHSHLADCFATKLLKPSSVVMTAGNVVQLVVGAIGAAPVFGVSQATHLVASDLLRIMHASHSHVEAAALN